MFVGRDWRILMLTTQIWFWINNPRKAPATESFLLFQATFKLLPYQAQRRYGHAASKALNTKKSQPQFVNSAVEVLRQIYEFDISNRLYWISSVGLIISNDLLKWPKQQIILTWLKNSFLLIIIILCSRIENDHLVISK